MKNLLTSLGLWLLGGIVTMALAETPLEIQRVADNVYAIVGELDQRRPENFANETFESEMPLTFGSMDFE